jgi:predicted nucleic acid-binding protein
VTLPDVNLLLHAYNRESPVHAGALAWWESLLNGTSPVGLSWVAMLGFIRIATHPQVLANPMPVTIACHHVRGWLRRPYVTVLDLEAAMPRSCSVCSKLWAPPAI